MALRYFTSPQEEEEATVLDWRGRWLDSGTERRGSGGSVLEEGLDAPTGFRRGSTRGVPGCGQPEEVPSVMSEQSTILVGRKGQLEFVRRSQMPGFSRCETVNTMLAEHGGENN